MQKNTGPLAPDVFLKWKRPNMSKSMQRLILLIGIALIPCAAAARDSAGALTFIKAPTSAQPQVVKPGAALLIDVAEPVYNSCGCRFHLYLDSEGGRVEMTDMTRLPDPATGVYRFAVTVAAGMEDGLYDLVAQKGANNDTALNSVSIVEELPAELRIMQIHDPRVDAATGLNLELAADLAAQDKPAFMVITGELVGENNTENITRLLDILNKMPAPVFVAYAGDDQALRSMFGPLPRVFTYGEYVFLLAAPGQSRTKACAEEPVRSLLDGNQDRQIDLRLFEKMNHSLYFDAGGDTSVIIPNPHDDDCLKAVQETVPPALFTDGAIRVFTFQGGTLADHKTVTIPR